VLALAVAFTGWAVYLATSAPDPQARAGWTRLKDMPRPRGEAAGTLATRVDVDEASQTTERLAVIGGLSGPGRTVPWVDFYNPETDEWVQGPDLPERRHHPGAVSTGGVLFVTGGSKTSTNWAPQDDTWFLFANDSTWQRGPAMPDARMAHQMVAIGGKLYVVGGRGESSNVLIFDVATKTWSTGAQMPVKRDHLAVAVLDGKIYAIGGRDARLQSRVDVYDPAEDEWSPGPPLPRPMSGMAFGATDDPSIGIHVLGGEDPQTIGGGVITEHYVLARGARAWVEAPLPIMPVHGASSATIFGKLYVAGGAARQGAFSPLAWRGVLQRFDG
jgi:N-acetylneuraminic acid mutarotase